MTVIPMYFIITVLAIIFYNYNYDYPHLNPYNKVNLRA